MSPIQPIRRTAASLLLIVAVIFTAGALTGCKQKTPEERLQEASQLLQQNQAPLAMIRLKDLVTEAPESEAAIDARMMLAQIYAQYQSKDYFERARQETTAVYEKVGLADPRGYNAFMTTTDLWLATENYDQALSHLESGVATAPEERKIELEMALNGLKMAGDDEELRQEGEVFFEDRMLNHETPSVRGQSRELLVQHFSRLGDLEKANQIYDQYMEKFPDETIISQLEIAKALNMKRMEEFDEDVADSLFEDGVAGMQQQIEDTLNLEDRARLRNDLALYLQSYGQYERAEQQFRKIMEENVQTLTAINAQFQIGQLYMARQETWDQASEHFAQMAKENPGSQIEQRANNARLEIGRFWLRNEGTWDRAEQYYDTLAAENEGTPFGEQAAAIANRIRDGRAQLEQRAAMAAQEAAESEDDAAPAEEDSAADSAAEDSAAPTEGS